jgi:hypothetical protein
MYLIPLEILRSIALLLSRADLCRFRLINHRCAAIAYPIITRHLFLLDTSWCIQDFFGFVRDHDSFLPFTKSITVYCGEWPRCPRREWKTHSLLRYEIHPGRRRIGQDSFEKSYRKYEGFVAEEDNRCSNRDQRTLSILLLCMPSIETVRFRPFRIQYKNIFPNSMFGSFINAIGVSPFFRGLPSNAFQTYIGPISEIISLKDLCIDGRIALGEVALL